MADIIRLVFKYDKSGSQPLPKPLPKKRCYVRECGVHQQDCPSTVAFHSSHAHNEFTVIAWKNFCRLDPLTKFPKVFYICQYHFTDDCHTPTGMLRRNSIPTIRIPLTLQAAESTLGNADAISAPSPLSIPFLPAPDVAHLVPVVLLPPVAPPKKSSTEKWTSFQDLRDALAPFAIKTPSSKWVILNFPHAKPQPKISFECLDGSVSVKSVTFMGSLDATVSVKSNRYSKVETSVHLASELETLLKKVDELIVRSCGCVEWSHISDFEHDLPKIKLPSEEWFASSLIKRQYQILFQRVDDHGRSIKTLSFSLNLLPRLHVRNERCLEDCQDFQDAVKCAHDVEKLLNMVNKLRVCSQTNYLPPAKADTQRKACQLVVLPVYTGKKSWDRTICPNCHRAKVHQQRKAKMEVKRKAEKEELLGLRRQMRKIEHSNDKLLFGSSDAVEKLLDQMNDVEEVDMDVDSEGEDVLTA